MTRDWAAKHGFTLFPEKGFESVTLTCVNNGAKPGGRTVDVAKLQLVKEQGFLIDGGYGKIKGTTFRLSNMGDETEATMNQLYAALDAAMAKPVRGPAGGEGYQLVQLTSGGYSLHSLLHGETFHPVIGPVAEAEALYVNQLRLRERSSSTPANS